MSGPTLVFASAAGGSSFMAELLDVVAEAVRTVGGAAVTHTGPLPDIDDAVYVIVPHEFLVVTPPADRPRPDQLRRTIGFAVEHPGTRTFEVSTALLGRLGGVVDINQDSSGELTRRGVRHRRFTLGYAPRWDRWGGDPSTTRSLDVTYLGTAERRRSIILGQAAAALADHSVRWLTPPHEPMTRPRPDFLMGAAKHRHLADARAIINLHRESSTALEWVRVLEAICNGCVVVTESSSDCLPLVPGRHLLMTAPAGVGRATAALLADRDTEERIRVQAYDFARTELDMAPSARALLELATDVLARPRAATTDARWPGQVHRRGSGASVAPPPRPVRPAPVDPPLAVDTPLFDPSLHHLRGFDTATGVVSAPIRAAAQLQVSRAIRAQRPGASTFHPASVVFGHPPDRPVVPVDVLVVRRPGDPSLDPLLDDLALGLVTPAHVFVAHDGPADGPVRPYTGTLLSPAPAGTGWCRTALLERSTADRLLVLDADMRCAPGLLRDLLDVDDDIAHCPVIDAAEGMVGALPMEARRLAALPYLGGGYLVRRRVLDALGGWVCDPWTEGLTDHLFWTAAAVGGSATLVQRPLLSRTWMPPPRRPLDLDPSRAWHTASRPRQPVAGDRPRAVRAIRGRADHVAEMR